jgi:shikimate kinase
LDVLLAVPRRDAPGSCRVVFGLHDAGDIHPAYARVRREIEQHPNTFVLLPSLDGEACVAETVRRQIARPFGRSSTREEAVIRARFEIYMAVPARKIETMRPVAAAVDEIVGILALEKT